MKLKKVKFNKPYFEKGDIENRRIVLKEMEGYMFEYNDSKYVVHRGFGNSEIWEVSDGESGLLIYSNNIKTRKECIEHSKSKIDLITDELRNKSKEALKDLYKECGIIA